MSTVPQRIGVVGAGTMGAGIAQLGVQAGMRTWLHDPVPDALDRGARNVRRYAEDAAAERLHLAATLDDLAQCELVIEAAPEDRELKRELFAGLSAICGPETVLATNTSSILVTALASAAARPENVVGMHFFNPPPLMKLLEVVRAEQTGKRALAVARAAGDAMGKQVIVARDGPGFLVNRCGRPFGGEALRLLQEGVATHEQIDRIVRLGGGFRMGPFELADLVGIDVGLAVARSFDEQSFGEPRWKPHPLQALKVATGELGRKTGRGWYDYGGDRPYRDDDPPAPEPGAGDGRRVAVDGWSSVTRDLIDRGRKAGFDARPPGDFGGGDEPELVLTLCADSTLAARDPTAYGFHLLPGSSLVELTRMPGTTPDAAERFFGAIGCHTEWVADAPGMVLGRLVCQLVNEALFAVGEGVGSDDDVDSGLELGLNHPRGPIAWAELIGYDHVVATVDALWDHFHDPRYRAAPELRRRAWQQPT